jgi:hypothetical protein
MTTTKSNWRSGPLMVSEKQTNQNGIRCGPQFLGFECANLDVIERRYEVGGNLCNLVFGHGIGNVTLIGLENILKRAAITGPRLDTGTIPSPPLNLPALT